MSWLKKTFQNGSIILMMVGSVYGQYVKPDINVTVSVGFAPLAAHFDCQELENTYTDIEALEWDFGDGSGSNDYVPVHIYETPGQYDVTLRYFRDNQWTTKRYPKLISVYSYETHAGLIPLEIHDHSHTWSGLGWDNAIDGDIIGEDGTVSAGQDPAWVIFSFPQSATVELDKMRLMVDTQIGHDNDWTKSIRLQTATEGFYQHHFTTIVEESGIQGDWQEIDFENTGAKYAMLHLDDPSAGFRQLGEVELYETIPNIMLSSASIDIESGCIANGVDSCRVMVMLKDENGAPLMDLSPAALKLAVWGGENETTPFLPGPFAGSYIAKFLTFDAGEKEIDIWFYDQLVNDFAYDGALARTEIIEPELQKVNLTFVDGSECRQGNGWDNLIDGDLDGSNGTTWAGPKWGDSWAIFRLNNAEGVQLQRFRLMCDTGFNNSRGLAQNYDVAVSETGTRDYDFTTIHEGRKSIALWDEIKVAPVTAKYVKITVRTPRDWRILGEFEVYEQIGPIIRDALFPVPEPSTDVVENTNQSGLPGSFELTQNYPNPFNVAGSFDNTTRLEYRIPETATVTVSVFNLLGQEVALLAHEEAMPGNYQVHWDGRNQFGDVLPTGIYFCRMSAHAKNVNFQQIVKMTVIQ